MSLLKPNPTENIYTELKSIYKDISESVIKLNKENLFLKISLNNDKNYVYVIDVATNKIVYVNDVMEKKFGDIIDTLCYESLSEYNVPCEYCNTNKLELNRPYSWVHYNKKIKKLFYIIDVLKEIKGVVYKFQKATDITDQIDNLKTIFNSENV